MNFSNLTLLEPWYLLTVPLYYILKWLFLKRVKASIFSNVELLNGVHKGAFNFAKVVEFLTILLISIALSNLALKDFKEQKSIQAHSIVLLLDASSSMQEQNRFNVAKEVVSNFLNKREGDEIALILFANYAYVASPLTYDKTSLKQMLKHINLGVAGTRGTALYEAIYQSTKLFNKSTKEKIVVLLSDGIDSVGTVSKQEALKRVKEANLKVYTIGLGKAGDVDSAFLKELANSSGGKFYLSGSAKELSSIYSQISSLEKSKIKSKTIVKYRYLSSYLIVASLILIAILLYLQNLNRGLVFIAVALLIMAIYLPNSSTKSVDKSSKVVNIALDVSNYMEAKDIYPTRLEFAKAKLLKSLKELKNQKVALYLYANKPYLISPPTSDYKRLEYAIKHLDLKSIKRNKSDILPLLKATKSSLILVTSGDNYSKYLDAKEYAKKESIKLYIYAIGTKEGGVAKLDSSNNLAVVSLNSNLKELADNYLEATPSNSLTALIDSMPNGRSSKVLELNKSSNKLLLILALVAYLLATLRGAKL